MQIKKYQPRIVITLFNNKEDLEVRGSLLFDNKYFHEDNNILKTSGWLRQSEINIYNQRSENVSKIAGRFIDVVESDIDRYQKKAMAISQYFSMKILSVLKDKDSRNKISLAGIVVSMLLISSTLFPVGISFFKYAPSTEKKVLANTPSEITNDYSQYEVGKGVTDQLTDNSFKITIPKINLESEVVMNVDTGIEKEYKEKLQYGVAHAKGTYLPGEKGPVFLFAHSTDSVENIMRYNAKFFGIKDLKEGDLIKINFRSKEYQYIITGKSIVDPSDLTTIQNSTSDLILQTCWPLGTDWQRLIIFAELIN